MLNKIREFIKENGFEEGVYRRDDIESHFYGAPTGIHVKPEYTPIDEAYMLVVITDTVFCCVLPHPTLRHNWRPRDIFHYKTKEELLDILKKHVARPVNCW